MIRIKVSASTSNLGSGFDAVGLALSLENVYAFDASNRFQTNRFKTFDPPHKNLIIKAYQSVFEKLGYARDLVPISVTEMKSDIPSTRGLGSSAACIVAGIFAANRMLDDPWTKEACFQHAAWLEGHPDNVAPAIFGGMVASYFSKNRYVKASYPVHEGLVFHVAIPPFSVKTGRAREVLPRRILHQEAAHAVARALHMPNAFAAGDIERIRDIFADTLHEPYRYPLIPGGLKLKETLERQGHAVAISGSGSTLLIVSKNEDLDRLQIDSNWDIRKVVIDYQGVEIISQG
jgi:homoserine kinase